MKIELVKVAALKPLEVNVRNHGAAQIRELKRSVEKFGQTRAIVIDEDNTVLIGNGLYFALREMNWETAECYRIKGLSDKEKKKLVLSDNKIYALGSDDYDNIEKLLAEITFDGDFEIAGFDEESLRQMFADAEQIIENVGNYGIVDDPKLAGQSNSETTGTTAPAQAPASVSESEPAPTTETPRPAEGRRSVMCPNCGEVIYLD